MIDSQMDNSPRASNALSSYALESSSDAFLSSMYVEALEDIEHPPWASTTSFSESCGSCLSRISSLCLDSKTNAFSEHLEVRAVPKHSYEDQHAEMPGISPQLISVPSLEHLNNPKLPSSFLKEGDVSGSLQSLASSSKTVYASPRSNSENQFYCPLSNTLLSEKAMQRRGSLYRERAPSENALDFHHAKSLSQSKLSHSLHDVSSIPSNRLKEPGHKSSGGISTSPLFSRNRSRDSGFIHSESLLSLSSGSRIYDHVESKVKHYIHSIKEAEAVRRKQRADSKGMVSVSPKQPSEDNDVEPVEDPELSHLVKKMQIEMEEKDQHLLKLQEDYNSLLSKYAEAENKIDRLRFGCSGNAHSRAPSHAPSRAPSSALENCSTVKNFQAWKSVNHQSTPRSLAHIEPQPLRSADCDDSSVTSSKFLLNLESFGSPDSSQSLFLKNTDGKKFTHNKKKKEVIISAPLRPISSLYCTSVRLDRVLPHIHSKPSSTASPVHFSCREPGRISSNSKKRKQTFDPQLPDNTFRGGTIDTGIDDCCPSPTGECEILFKTEPIEDPIVKVQRWQKSLSSPPHPEYSPCSAKDLPNRVVSSDKYNVVRHSEVLKTSSHDTSPKTVTATKYSSIGIQVNLDQSTTFPSLSSSLPMVPCLNLELSGCTGEVSESAFSSHVEGLAPHFQLSSGSDPSYCENSNAAVNFDVSMPSKSFSSKTEVSNPKKCICEGKCKICGCLVQMHENHVKHIERRVQKGVHSSPKEKSSLCLDKKSKMERVQRTVSQLSATELAKVIALVLKDQDHVVPASPGEEKSLQHVVQSLQRKMNSLKYSIDLQTLVSLLHVLLENLSSKKSECDCNHSPSSSNGKGDVLQHGKVGVSIESGVSEEDCSLLRCLDEMDEYTHQVWAKTESFLEALDSKKSGSFHKPK